MRDRPGRPVGSCLTRVPLLRAKPTTKHDRGPYDYVRRLILKAAGPRWLYINRAAATLFLTGREINDPPPRLELVGVYRGKVATQVIKEDCEA